MSCGQINKSKTVTADDVMKRKKEIRVHLPSPRRRKMIFQNTHWTNRWEKQNKRHMPRPPPVKFRFSKVKKKNSSMSPERKQRKRLLTKRWDRTISKPQKLWRSNRNASCNFGNVLQLDPVKIQAIIYACHKWCHLETHRYLENLYLCTLSETEFFNFYSRKTKQQGKES